MGCKCPQTSDCDISNKFHSFRVIVSRQKKSHAMLNTLSVLLKSSTDLFCSECKCVPMWIRSRLWRLPHSMQTLSSAFFLSLMLLEICIESSHACTVNSYSLMFFLDFISHDIKPVVCWITVQF